MTDVVRARDRASGGNHRSRRDTLLFSRGHYLDRLRDHAEYRRKMTCGVSVDLQGDSLVRERTEFH